MTSKEQILDKAIVDIQNQIMFAWKAVMMYEEQLRNSSVYEASDEILLTLIEAEKYKIETLTAVLNVLEPPAPETSEVEAAKSVLRKAGYHVDSLWHVQDVTNRYECGEEMAYEILTAVLNANIDTIFDLVHNQAKYENNLKEKNDDL